MEKKKYQKDAKLTQDSSWLTFIRVAKVPSGWAFYDEFPRRAGATASDVGSRVACRRPFWTPMGVGVNSNLSVLALSLSLSLETFNFLKYISSLGWAHWSVWSLEAIKSYLSRSQLHFILRHLNWLRFFFITEKDLYDSCSAAKDRKKNY